MSLRLYDSATQEVREFEPLHPGRVGLYVCGPTVQSAPHVGHLRSGIAFDILVRWLRRSGYDVTFIRNVTDIDDKILAKAQAADVPWWAWAYQYEGEFARANAALGLLPPTYEPRATGHIGDMVALMERLVERGHAYVGRPGNVYFDVSSYPRYGALTHQGLEHQGLERQGGEPTGAGGPSEDDKRDPRDFALWKAPKPGEPETAAWPTPFGVGRPGWHLECSAMARRYLGETFDIHGGGLDLRFPHHENEQAQSQAAGYGFARWWMHNAWVTQSGEKMSKSLGNSLLVSEVLAQHRPVVVRYALAVAHYRSMIEFSPETVAEAANAWDRLSGFVTRATNVLAASAAPGEEPPSAEDLLSPDGPALPPAFVEAMDDDLNVPAALAVIHEQARKGNTALADGDEAAIGAATAAVRGMLAVLGLDPLASTWQAATEDDRYRGALDAIVRDQLAARADARAARDYAAADAIRDRLANAGVTVEDSPTGARWNLDAH